MSSALKLEKFYNDDPLAILQWACREFPSGLALSTSLGPQTSVLIDMLYKLGTLPRVYVFFLDTGLLFHESYRLRQQLERHYHFAIDAVRPRFDLDEQKRVHGETLWQKNPDLCCNIRKVEPMRRILLGMKAYITGLRRDQNITRQHIAAVEWDEQFQITKINPLAAWSRTQIDDYLKTHHVPYNPLLDQGYKSIGCAPCTIAVTEHMEERAGRWAGTTKTECGLHKRLPIVDTR